MDPSRMEKDCIVVKEDMTYEAYRDALKAIVDRISADNKEKLAKASFASALRQTELCWVEVAESTRLQRWDWTVFYSYKYVLLVLDHLRKHPQYASKMTRGDQVTVNKRAEEAMGNVESGCDGYLKVFHESRLRRARAAHQKAEEAKERLLASKRGFVNPRDASHVNAALVALFSTPKAAPLLAQCRGTVANALVSMHEELQNVLPGNPPVHVPAEIADLQPFPPCAFLYLQELAKQAGQSIAALLTHNAAVSTICPAPSCASAAQNVLRSQLGVDLPIPVPPNPYLVSFSLEECLATYCADQVSAVPAVPTYSNAFRCPTCLKYHHQYCTRRAVLCLDGAPPPHLLAIKLQRFPNAVLKVSTDVSLPQILDVTQFCVFGEKEKCRPVYELVAVVNHTTETLQDPRYTVDALREHSTWFRYADGSVARTTAPLSSTQASMVLYRLKQIDAHVPVAKPVAAIPAPAQPAVAGSVPAPDAAGVAATQPAANPYAVPPPPSPLPPPPAVGAAGPAAVPPTAPPTAPPAAPSALPAAPPTALPTAPSVAPPLGPPPGAAPPVFATGTKVWYHGREGRLAAQVVAEDSSVTPRAYVVRILPAGAERHTEAARLTAYTPPTTEDVSAFAQEIRFLGDAMRQHEAHEAMSSALLRHASLEAALDDAGSPLLAEHRALAEACRLIAAYSQTDIFKLKLRSGKLV
eukprot:Rhum_TRINITY_DN15336_c1_g1::Rhum_TRINITY_DN15336_c1_g1_i1::g.149720::m.149720